MAAVASKNTGNAVKKKKKKKKAQKKNWFIYFFPVQSNDVTVSK
jgi:hypothetical protein